MQKSQPALQHVEHDELERVQNGWRALELGALPGQKLMRSGAETLQDGFPIPVDPDSCLFRLKTPNIVLQQGEYSLVVHVYHDLLAPTERGEQLGLDFELKRGIRVRFTTNLNGSPARCLQQSVPGIRCAALTVYALWIHMSIVAKLHRSSSSSSSSSICIRAYGIADAYGIAPSGRSRMHDPARLCQSFSMYT